MLDEYTDPLNADKIKIFERIKKEFGYDTTTNIDFLKILGDYLREFDVKDIGFDEDFINKYTNKLENDKIIEAQRKLEEERQRQRKLEEEEIQRKLEEALKSCPAYTYEFGSELKDVVSILNMDKKAFKKLQLQLHTDKNNTCEEIAKLKIQFLNSLRNKDDRISMFEDNVNLDDHTHEKTIDSFLKEIENSDNYDIYNTKYKEKYNIYQAELQTAKEKWHLTIEI